jgi:hypothetical protein
LAILVLALLAVVGAGTAELPAEKRGEPVLIHLTIPEVRRLLVRVLWWPTAEPRSVLA